MPRLMRIVTLSVFALFISANTITAGSLPVSVVPVEKSASKPAPTTRFATSGTAGTKMNKAQLRRELKAFKKENASSSSSMGRKSKVAAALLAFFLGGFGVHRFYMGQKKEGFIQLGLTLVGIGLIIAGLANYVSGLGESFPTLALIGYVLVLGVSIWAFIDFIRILTGGLEPEEGFDS
jgi:TM2 domain-containing membrane protein YozV